MIVGTRGERIVGWKAIADALGIDVWTLKHALYRADLRLPKLKPDSRTSPVYTSRRTLEMLLRPLFSANGKAG
jgi:hypothetical protein